VAREAQEVAGGGWNQSTTPAAENSETEQGNRGARRKKGEELNQGCFAILEKNRDLTEKSLQLLNQCSNGDGPKSKSAWFFKLYNFSLRFICI
jgi:hypothetical protein